MKELDFRRGYYLAVATMMRLHGCKVTGCECLKAYGKINFRGIEPYDKAVLMPLAKEIKRRRKLNL